MCWLLNIVKMSLSVQYIGASWCKVCVTVKPDVEKICTGFNVPLAILDADEDAVEVSKVPTLRLYLGPTMVKEITTGHVVALRAELEGRKGLILDSDF